MSAVVQMPKEARQSPEDLTAIEAGLGATEREMRLQVERVEPVAVSLAERVRELHDRVQSARTGEPELGASSTRRAEIDVPELDVNRQMQELLRLRQAAITSRTNIIEGLRQSLAKHSAQLESIATTLDDEARSLE